MNTIFMNSKSNLFINHTDKIDLRTKDKYIGLSNLGKAQGKI